MFVGVIAVVTITLAGVSNCLEQGEPKCYSRYDWEEKVLEKTIRTELEMKEYLKSMNAALEYVRDYKKEFETIKMEVSQKIQDTKTTLSGLMDQMTRDFDGLKGKVSSPTVTFSARTLSDRSPAAHQILVFGTVMQNIGDAYDATTGIFTAPVNGTFMFVVQLCVHTSKWAQYQLAVDSPANVILTCRHYNSDSADAISSSISHYLTKGQRVWLQSYSNSGSSNILFDQSDCWNQFSGTLVNY